MVVVDQVRDPTTHRVLITGSRDWDTPDRVWVALELQFGRAYVENKTLVVIHGGARGADSQAAAWADRPEYRNKVAVGVYTADWDTHGKAAGPIRNQEMVDAGADICLAFPKGKSPGTRDCILRARQAGIPVIVHSLDDDPEQE